MQYLVFLAKNEKFNSLKLYICCYEKLDIYYFAF